MSDDMNDMKTKTDEELYAIVAEEEAKKEKQEREFRLMVVKSLIRIEKELERIRENDLESIMLRIRALGDEG